MLPAAAGADATTVRLTAATLPAAGNPFCPASVSVVDPPAGSGWAFTTRAGATGT
jgi:hypothetical protein